MKQTNNAIKFLMAQYRAIFNNAYFKGLTSAMLLTAGMAVAGGAQAAANDAILDAADFSSTSGSAAEKTIKASSDVDVGKLESGKFSGSYTFLPQTVINGADITITGAEQKHIVIHGNSNGHDLTIQNGGSLTLTNSRTTSTQVNGGLDGTSGTLTIKNNGSSAVLTQTSFNFNKISISSGASVTLGGLMQAEKQRRNETANEADWAYYTNLSANNNGTDSGSATIANSTINLNDQSMVTADDTLEITGNSVINFDGTGYLDKNANGALVAGDKYATAFLRAGNSANTTTSTVNVSGDAVAETTPILNVAESAWGAIYADTITLTNTQVNINDGATFILDGNWDKGSAASGKSLTQAGKHKATNLTLDDVTFDNKGTAIIGNAQSGGPAKVTSTVDLQGKVNNFAAITVSGTNATEPAKLIISEDQLLRTKNSNGTYLSQGMFAGTNSSITLSGSATDSAILSLVGTDADGLNLNTDVSFGSTGSKIVVSGHGTIDAEHLVLTKALSLPKDAQLTLDGDILELGANDYRTGSLTGLGVARSIAHDHFDAQASGDTFTIDGSLLLSRDYYTKDTSGDYTTTLNEVGRITGDNLVIGNSTTSGTMTISGGAFVNEGQSLTISSGDLTVGAVFNYDANGDGTVNDDDTSVGSDGIAADPDWEYYKNGNPASLTWTGDFKINGTSGKEPDIKVTGAHGATATLDLTRANITWGSGAITLSGAGVDSDGDPDHTSATDYFATGGEGVLTITGNQFFDYLDLEGNRTEHTTSTSITLENGGVLLVEGSVGSPINFNKLSSTESGAGTIYFNNGGRLIATGDLSLVTGVATTAGGAITTDTLDLGSGAIVAQGISINNRAPDLDPEDDYVAVSGGTLYVSSYLSTANKEIRFSGASMGLETDGLTQYGVPDSNNGFVNAAKLTFIGNNSNVAVNTGNWTIGANGTLGDVDLTEGALMSVGAYNHDYIRDPQTASLSLDNLSLAGTPADEDEPNLAVHDSGVLNVNTMQVADGTDIDIDNATLVINGRTLVAADFKNESEPESLVDLGEEDGIAQAGIDLTGATIDVTNQGHFVLGDTAAKALIQFSKEPAEGSDIVEINDALASATISLRNSSELKLDFAKGENDASAPEVNGGQGLTAEQAAMLKNKLIDNLESGSFINVGGLALDIKYDKETMTAQWSDIEGFFQVVSDVANNDVKQILVQGITYSDEISGQFGAVEADSVGQNTIRVNGNLGLHKARDGYFASVVGTDGQRKAIGLDLTQNSYLQLAGEGNVGTLKGTGTNTNAEVVFAEGEYFQGATTVEGDIRAIGSITVNNDVNVTGDVTVGAAEINQALSAKNVTLEGGNNGTSLITGTLTASEELTVGAASQKNTLTVANGKVTSRDLVLANGSTLQVGLNAAESDDPDTTFNEAANYTGSLEAQTVDLGNGGVIVDPVNELQSAIVSFNKFKDASTAQNSMDLGTINGSVYVGNNSVLGIGSPDLASLRKYVAKHQNNGSLVDYGAILAVNGQATLDAGKGIVMTAQMPDDFKAYMTEKQWSLDSYNTVADSIYFGDGTVMKVTAEAINTIGAPNNKNALITISSNDGKLIADGGEILISGEVRAGKPYTFFTDGDNAVEVVNVDKSNAEAGEGINVRTENGFLQGEINSTNVNDGLTLGVNPNSRSIMVGASDPVYDTLVAYVRGYNGPEPVEGESTIAPEADTNGNGVEDSRELYSYEQGEKVLGQYSNYFLNESVAAGNGAAAESVARLAIYGGAAQAAISAGASTYDAVSGRMGVGANGANITVADNTQGAALWLAPIYKSSDSDGFDAEGVDYGVDMDLYGVALGADYTLSNGIRFGAMFNVGSGDVDGQGAGSAVSNDFDYYGFAVYGGYSMGALSVVADVSYTVADNDLEGNTSIDKVGASLDSTNLSVGVTGQYQLDFNGTTVTPHAGLRFSRIDLDDYTVDGEDIIADYDADSMNIFSIPVGVTFAKEFTGDAWTVKPSLDLTLTGNFGDDETDGTVHWAGVENLSTNVSSEVLDNFTYGATLGVAAKTGNFSLGLGVNYTGSSNVDEFGVQANARFVF